jgi:predicted chitinase
MPEVQRRAWFNYIYGASTHVGNALGNTSEGDGFKYRGRGLVQLTGRGNYHKYGEASASTSSPTQT